MGERNWKPVGNTDWLENKRAKSLRVSNEREAFQLKKIRRSIDSMKTINDNLLKQEERKVKKWLKKQAQLSPSSSTYKTLYYKTSSYPASSQEQFTDTHPASRKDSIETPWTQFGDHLPNFVSFLRLPTKRPSNDRKNSKDLTPFSGIDLPMQTISGRNVTAPRIHGFPPYRDTRKGSSPGGAIQDNSISLQEAMAFFPSLQRLSARRDRVSLSTLLLHKPLSAFPALKKQLKSLLEKEWEEENSKPLKVLPEIKPEEFLSCRYLRLSQSNIDTLLKMCREAGIYIDLHPHMKASDIDVSKVLSSSPSKVL